MASSINLDRIFLGDDRPLLTLAAQWLVSAAPDCGVGVRGLGGLDHSQTVVVVPGRRFGRLLRLAIAERAEAQSLWLSPPRILTPGDIGPHRASLSGASGERAAGEHARLLAWAHVLAEHRDLAESVFPSLRLRRDKSLPLSSLLPEAGVLDRTCADVLRSGRLLAEMKGTLVPDGEEEMWSSIVSLFGHYEQCLARCGLREPGSILIEAAASSDRSEMPLVLVGVLELDPITRRLVIEGFSNRRVLVHATSADAGLFDELGLLKPAADVDDVELEAESIEIVPTMAQLGHATVRTVERLAEMPGESSNRGRASIAVGGLAAGAIRAILDAMADAGLEVHDAVGRPFVSTPTGRLLSALSDFLERPTLLRLRSLATMPQLEDVVDRRLAREGEGEGEGVDAAAEPPKVLWLERLDCVLSRRGDTSIDASDLDDATRSLVSCVCGLIPRVLLEQTAADLGELIDALAWFLSEHVLGDEREEVSGLERDAGERIGSCLQSISSVAGLGTSWRGAELVRAVGALCDGETLAQPGTSESLEVLGWLDAAADASSRLVLAGLAEGCVPQAPGGNSLVSTSLRCSLGLSDLNGQARRDAFLLRSCVRSRQAGSVCVIVSRQDEDGSPLLPSRLLMRCPDDLVLDRVGRWICENERTPVEEPSRPQPAGPRAFPAAPLIDAKVPTVLNVSKLDAYLRSPYLFFAEHVLSLREMEEPPEEAAPRSLSDVLHLVLSDLGTAACRDSADPAVLSAFLLDRLETRLAELPLIGDVLIREAQRDAMHRRLRHFAQLQAQHRADGWRIAHTEWNAEGFTVALTDKLSVRGRVDRIDERDGELLVLDYKISDSSGLPQSIGKETVDRWTSLQLPIYRQLVVERLAAGRPVRAGYVRLPKRASEAQILIARWTDEAYQAALAEAKRLACDLVAGKFAERGEGAFGEGGFARLCGEMLLEEDEDS